MIATNRLPYFQVVPLPHAVTFRAAAIENGMADHPPAIDPGVVARCVRINPALRPHALPIGRRHRAMRPGTILQVAASPGGHELVVALLRVDRGPVCRVRLRGHRAAEQQSRNHNNTLHGISSMSNAPPYSSVVQDRKS